jgi:hypothetical protein
MPQHPLVTCLAEISNASRAAAELAATRTPPVPEDLAQVITSAAETAEALQRTLTTLERTLLRQYDDTDRRHDPITPHGRAEHRADLAHALRCTATLGLVLHPSVLRGEADRVSTTATRIRRERGHALAQAADEDQRRRGY